MTEDTEDTGPQTIFEVGAIIGDSEMTAEQLYGLETSMIKSLLGLVDKALRLDVRNARLLTAELLRRHETLEKVHTEPPIEEEQPPEPEPEEPPTVPAQPKPPTYSGEHEDFLGINPPEAFDRVLEIPGGYSADQMRAAILQAGANRPGSLVVLRDSADYPALRLGHANGIPGPDGAPLRDVEIRGAAGAKPVVSGVKLYGPDAGTGCGTVKLTNLVAQPMHLDDASAIQVHPGGGHIGAHLVLEDVYMRGTPGSKKFNGCRYKWGLIGHEFRLSSRHVTAEGGQEHPFYGHSMLGGALLDEWRVAPVRIYPSGGPEQGILAGFGRTAGQVVARANEGPAGSGDIIWRRLHAERCGWEGLTGRIDGSGSFVGIDPLYGKGGGSAITVSGHTGGRVIIDGYRGVDNYCSELAVYPDNKTGTGWLQVEPTELNPHGVRTYLLDVDTGEEFNPIGHEEREAYGYMTPALVISDWRANRARASRQAMLLDGFGALHVDDARVNGRAILSASDPELRTGYYEWAPPIRSMGFVNHTAG